MDSALDLLKKYWGFDSFRPLQEDIVNAVVQGENTLVLLPTGGGKSICYQIPGLLLEGITLVVSPLVALMKDQVENLEKRDIGALALHSGLSKKEINLAVSNAQKGRFKFIYISPERLTSTEFKEWLPHLNIALIAVDEAHCISQWGHDFRPDYLRIPEISPLVKNAKWIALTASATKTVVEEIIDNLQWKDNKIFKTGFSRPNLSYSVIETENKQQKIAEICSKLSGSGLVYCATRKQSVDTAQFLLSVGIGADFYHAGLSAKSRNLKQDGWVNNNIRVMVCTNAFGMGIDKPNVRFVIHHQLPSSIEAYYQESGRAGRDGKKSYCVLLFQHIDEIQSKHQINIHFPELEVLSRVYIALCNHFKVAIGSGIGSIFNFELNNFCQLFNLKPLEVTNSIKLLESQQFIEITESFYHPSRVRILFPYTDLYNFKLKKEQFELLINTLLRSYGGIFDNYLVIDEAELAKRMKVEVSHVIAQLNILHKLEIIDYLPQNDLPKLMFKQNRPSEFKPNSTLINHLKESYLSRLSALIGYIKNTEECRMLQLTTYFNDSSKTSCGVCDVCIRKRKEQNELNPKTKSIEWIKKQLKDIEIPKDELIKMAGHSKKDEICDTLRWLMDNEFVLVTKNNNIIWNLEKE